MVTAKNNCQMLAFNLGIFHFCFHQQLDGRTHQTVAEELLQQPMQKHKRLKCANTGLFLSVAVSTETLHLLLLAAVGEM